jgi:hypothetical protein
MDEAKLRGWWAHRQGLDGRLSGKSAAEVLAATGWARSIGGAGPYINLFARCGALPRAVDAAIEALAIHELPAARGCTYVVPAAAYALALSIGQGGPEAEIKIARKLGVTDAEIDCLCQAVLDALAPAPLEPSELRAAAGGAVRSLGEEGKKKGITTTLPLALGRLQSAGEIRRVSTNGRLDNQRYRYALWRPNPLHGFSLSPEERAVEVARLFFAWIGPARLADFQTFTALGAKAARAAVEPLGLVTPTGDGPLLMLPAQAAELRSFAPPRRPHYSLVTNLDGMLLLRNDVKSLLAPEDWEREAAGTKGAAPLASVHDLMNHAILDRGRLVGLWEYDSAAGEIAWISFLRPDDDLRAAVSATEAMIRDQLGDMRSFSLDSPKSRAPRLAALRAARSRTGW